jgi:hypothetical protein
MSEELEQPKPEKNWAPPNKFRGGARPGAGRPKGTTNKITAKEFLERFKVARGHDYIEELIIDFKASQDMIDAFQAMGEKRGVVEALGIKNRYHGMVAKYVWHDVKELDVTSNGESLVGQFVFTSKELPEWKAEEGEYQVDPDKDQDETDE